MGMSMLTIVAVIMAVGMGMGFTIMGMGVNVLVGVCPSIVVVIVQVFVRMFFHQNASFALFIIFIIIITESIGAGEKIHWNYVHTYLLKSPLKKGGSQTKQSCIVKAGAPT
jgi:hypothetical protein